LAAMTTATVVASELTIISSSDTTTRLFPTPGHNPTNHDFTNFAHICKIFSQICVKFSQICENESYQIFMNICKLNLAYFTSIIQ
jgi:hypothetical protein